MAARENYSRKRVAILEALRSTTVHPTAEWVYEHLKPQYSDLSLGTVYRNLKKFCTEDKVRSIGVIDGQEHFDGNVEPHSHFLCRECGAVLDIDRIFFPKEVLYSLSSQYGILITGEDLVFRGLCKACMISAEEKPKQ